MHPCVGSDAIATALPCVVRRRKPLELYVSGATSASARAPRSVAHLQMPSHPTGHRADFGHCHDHTAALSGRDCGRPEGSAHRTMRSDRAVTTHDLRGGGAGPRGDRSRGDDRDFPDGDAFDSYVQPKPSSVITSKVVMQHRKGAVYVGSGPVQHAPLRASRLHHGGLWVFRRGCRDLERVDRLQAQIASLAGRCAAPFNRRSLRRYSRGCVQSPRGASTSSAGRK